MHPLLSEQLKTVERQLAGLKAALEQQNHDKREQFEAHQELQKEQFRQRKQIVTISHLTEDLQTASQKVDIYQAERTHLRENLQSLLAAVKGLRSATDD